MSDRLARDLKALIDATEKKEHECRYYLQYIKDQLVKTRVIEYKNVETERIGYTGRSDYMISALTEEGGAKNIKVYLWELKAPQSFIFKKDNNHRLKPSDDLIDAENKLLHYYLENRDSGTLYRQYQITSSDDVCIGGIIIGSTNTKVSGEYDDNTKNRLYRMAKSSRDLLYRPVSIKLLTWDDVVGYIRLNEIDGEEAISEEEISLQPDWLHLEAEYKAEYYQELDYEPPDYEPPEPDYEPPDHEPDDEEPDHEPPDHEPDDEEPDHEPR